MSEAITPEWVDAHYRRMGQLPPSGMAPGRGDAVSVPAKPRANKFGVSTKDDRTYNGIAYDSRREMQHAMELDLLLKTGVVTKIERQMWVPLVVDGHAICSIVVDFRVTYQDGRVLYEEVKGFDTAIWKLKRKLFTALYPELEYKVIR